MTCWGRCGNRRAGRLPVGEPLGERSEKQLVTCLMALDGPLRAFDPGPDYGSNGSGVSLPPSPRWRRRQSRSRMALVSASRPSSEGSRLRAAASRRMSKSG